MCNFLPLRRDASCSATDAIPAKIRPGGELEVEEFGEDMEEMRGRCQDGFGENIRAATVNEAAVEETKAFPVCAGAGAGEVLAKLGMGVGACPVVGNLAVNERHGFAGKFVDVLPYAAIPILMKKPVFLRDDPPRFMRGGLAVARLEKDGPRERNSPEAHVKDPLDIIEGDHKKHVGSRRQHVTVDLQAHSSREGAVRCQIVAGGKEAVDGKRIAAFFSNYAPSYSLSSRRASRASAGLKSQLKSNPTARSPANTAAKTNPYLGPPNASLTAPMAKGPTAAPVAVKNKITPATAPC